MPHGRVVFGLEKLMSFAISKKDRISFFLTFGMILYSSDSIFFMTSSLYSESLKK